MPLFLETLTETKAFICCVELDFLPKSRILLVCDCELPTTVIKTLQIHMCLRFLLKGNIFEGHS